jgi:hypothetical protein
MTLALLTLLAAAPVFAAPDCTDPYIAARKVPECVQAAPTMEDLAEASQSLKEFRDSPEFAGAVKRGEGQARAQRAMSALGFDGSQSRARAAVVVPADWGGARPSLAGPTLEPSSSEVDSPRASEVPSPVSDPAPSATPAEAARQKLSAAVFHGTWLLDLISTIQVIRGGGYEMDPLYTLFGATNLVGVVLSMIAFHVLITLLQRWAYRKLQTLQGPDRVRWERLMLLFNLFSVAHVWGAFHNVGVIARLARAAK